MRAMIRLVLLLAVVALSYAQAAPLSATGDPCEVSYPVDGIECKKCDYYDDPWGCYGASCCFEGTSDCIYWGGCEN